MNETSTPARASTRRRVLGLVGVVFFTTWALVASILFLLHATWPAYVGSLILFGGFFISWVITVYVLNRKNPKYVEALLYEDEDEKKKTANKS
jgi:hypothetical protein